DAEVVVDHLVDPDQPRRFDLHVDGVVPDLLRTELRAALGRRGGGEREDADDRSQSPEKSNPPYAHGGNLTAGRRCVSGYRFALLDAAHEGGVATPEVWFLLEADDRLGSGFVMERIEGETIPRRILRDDAYASARPVLARQCGEQAARIHALDPARLPSLPVQGAREQIAVYRGYLDGLG